MQTTPQHNQRIASMTFASVYPLYVAKIERKGRTIAELNQVIYWLTGYDTAEIEKLVASNVTFETFFAGARINLNATLVKGVICGYKIETIENNLTKNVRILDKLVDELAKGKTIEKILRS
jgi:hypothetical protein